MEDFPILTPPLQNEILSWLPCLITHSSGCTTATVCQKSHPVLAALEDCGVFLVLQPFLRYSCGRPHSALTTQRKKATVGYRERASSGSSIVTANPVQLLSYQEDTQPLTTWERAVTTYSQWIQHQLHALLPKTRTLQSLLPNLSLVVPHHLGRQFVVLTFFWGDVNKYLFIPDRAMRKKRGGNHPYPIWQTNGFILLTEHGGGVTEVFLSA